jgi:hypothetical protein
MLTDLKILQTIAVSSSPEGLTCCDFGAGRVFLLYLGSERKIKKSFKQMLYDLRAAKAAEHADSDLKAEFENKCVLPGSHSSA